MTDAVSEVKEEHTVYLGLGSNMGDRKATLDAACQKIERLIGHIVRQSAYHESEPWGFQSENTFLNAVVCCTTTLSPRQLLRTTQRIERQLGKRRQHASVHPSPLTTQSSALSPQPSALSPQPSTLNIYHDRPIDIDILLYDDLHIDEPDLIIPHPRMHQRPFVMEPLQEIL